MEIINRIKADLMIWLEKENDQATLPGANIRDKRFLKEKLAYLDGIALKYKNNLSLEERLTLIHVDRIREQIKKSNLNFLERMYRKLTTSSREKAIMERQADLTGRQMEALTGIVHQLGFSNVKYELIRQTEVGRPAFDIPVSVYKSPTERMDYVLHFERDRHGQYQLDHFRAKLNDASRQTTSAEVTFKRTNSQFFSASQAYNLLAGRAVALQYTDPVNGLSQSPQTIWYKLDLSSSVETSVKEFWPEQAFNPEETLNQLRLKNKDQDLLKTVYPQLMQGHRVAIEVTYQQQCRTIYLEADPQINGFKFYNDFQTPITKWDALQIKDPATTPPKDFPVPLPALDKQITNQAQSVQAALAADKQMAAAGEIRFLRAIKTKSARKKIINRMRKV